MVFILQFYWCRKSWHEASTSAFASKFPQAFSFSSPHILNFAWMSKSLQHILYGSCQHWFTNSKRTLWLLLNWLCAPKSTWMLLKIPPWVTLLCLWTLVRHWSKTSLIPVFLALQTEFVWSLVILFTKQC